MTSLAKIKANIANGRRSRGPRTAEGKVKSRLNAFKHGIAAITQRSPKIFTEIEPVARLLCDGVTHPLLFEQALIIAENALVLRCMQAEYIATIERHRDITATPLATGDLGFTQAKATLANAKLTYKMLLKRETLGLTRESTAAAEAAVGEPNNNSNSTRSNTEAPNQSEHAAPERVSAGSVIRERDEFDAMRAAMPDLNRLERYRRRAWSRQRRAMRRFMEIQMEIQSVAQRSS